MKKLLLLLFVANLIPFMARASVGDSFDYNGITYTVIDETDKTCFVGSIDFESNSGVSGDIIIPSSVPYNGSQYTVTVIGSFAFSYCTSLTSITLPSTLTAIYSHAFENCKSLTEIFIPKRVNHIDSNSFINCMSLTAINVDMGNDNYVSINGVLFSKDMTILIEFPGGKSGDYIIPAGVKSIEEEAFSYCKNLTSISLPDGITSIGMSAFSDCTNLTSISLPEGLTSIEAGVFSHCTNLTSVSLPESITEINFFAFRECTNLSSINIPENITLIGGLAFDGCYSITEISLPKGITAIEFRTFSNCTGLNKVSLPENIMAIDEQAFVNCFSLSIVNSYATTPPECYNDDVFAGIPSDAVLHVPVGTKNAYATAIGWSIFSNIIDDLNPIMGVKEIETSSKDADDSVMVYNLQGLRMGASNRSELPSLPSGIYIIGGRKVLVK